MIISNYDSFDIYDFHEKIKCFDDVTIKKVSFESALSALNEVCTYPSFSYFSL